MREDIIQFFLKDPIVKISSIMEDIKKCKNYSFIYNNQKVDIFNLREFCRKNNLDQGAMTRVNSGKQIIHKGYSKWQQLQTELILKLIV